MPKRPSPDVTIGERIKARRQLRGWSIRFAADRAGVSHSTWSRIERGLMSADNRFMVADIAAALECSVAELAGHLGVAGDPQRAAAHNTVHELRRVLVETALDEPPAREAAPLPAIQQRLDLVRHLYRRCDNAAVGRLLPELLTDLHAAGTGRHHAEVMGMSVEAHLLAMATLKHLGHPAEAWLAAERGQQVAQRLGDPVAVAVAEFGRTCAATGCDGYGRAYSLASRAADEIGRHLSAPRGLEALGLLTLRMAFSAAALKREDETSDRIADARDIAGRVGEAGSWEMFFGPTNVDFWRVSVEVDAGDPGRAVEIAKTVNPAIIGAPVRQSAFYADMARALTRMRRDQEATRYLRTAERMDPVRLRSSPLAREAARTLLERSRRRTTGSELHALCERMGIGS